MATEPGQRYKPTGILGLPPDYAAGLIQGFVEIADDDADVHNILDILAPTEALPAPNANSRYSLVSLAMTLFGSDSYTTLTLYYDDDQPLHPLLYLQPGVGQVALAKGIPFPAGKAPQVKCTPDTGGTGVFSAFFEFMLLPA